MRRAYAAGVASAIVILLISVLLWTNYSERIEKLRHETSRWVVIEDVDRNIIALEPIANNTWEQLIQLNQNKSSKLIGGIVERYENKWGFRFKPESIRISDFTAEGLQATIRYISENLDYWLDGWSYVSAKVTEIHNQT